LTDFAPSCAVSFLPARVLDRASTKRIALSLEEIAYWLPFVSHVISCIKSVHSSNDFNSLPLSISHNFTVKSEDAESKAFDAVG
jgi:hypothetical protein